MTQAAEGANERLGQQKKYKEDYEELLKLLDELPRKMEHPIMVPPSFATAALFTGVALVFTGPGRKESVYAGEVNPHQ